MPGIEDKKREMRHRAARERMLHRLDLLADLLADSIQALQAVDGLFKGMIKSERLEDEKDAHDSQPSRD